MRPTDPQFDVDTPEIRQLRKTAAHARTPADRRAADARLRAAMKVRRKEVLDALAYEFVVAADQLHNALAPLVDHQIRLARLASLTRQVVGSAPDVRKRLGPALDLADPFATLLTTDVLDTFTKTAAKVRTAWERNLNRLKLFEAD